VGLLDGSGRKVLEIADHSMWKYDTSLNRSEVGGCV
jgi:hypothetical protein